MAAPQQLYTEFNAASPESLRTIRFSGRSLTDKCNEYNISVWNINDNSPATGTIQGIVSVSAYSPGADRPEQTDNTVDLATGCRKFNLFFATIERAVFSVSGLAPGLMVRVEAFRSSGLIVADNGLNTLDPVNLREWTPNYNGAGYIDIPDWTTRNGTIELSVFLPQRDGTGGNRYIFDNDENSDRLFFIHQASGALQFNSGITVQVDGEDYTAGDVVQGIHTITLTVSATADRILSFIGRVWASASELFSGQIYNLRLTDLDDPGNSRFYPSIISSGTQPTTTTLVDEISGENGILTNFPIGMEWTEVNRGDPVILMDLRNDLSVFPSSAGTATFARNSIATGVRDGVLSQVEANQARFEDYGILIEGQSRNLLRFFDAQYTDFQTRSNGRDSPEPIQGFVNSVEFNSLSSGSFVYQTPDFSGVSDGDTYTFSFYCENENGEEPRVTNSTSGNFDFRVVLGGGDTISNIESENFFKNIFRVSVTATRDISNSQVNINGLLALTAFTNPRAFKFSGFQQEPISIASSAIPTTGAALTRPPDQLTVPFPISGTQDFTVFIVARINGFQNQTPRYFSSSSGNSFTLRTTSQGQVAVFAGGNSITSESGQFSPFDIHVVALARTAIFVNGQDITDTGSLSNLNINFSSLVIGREGLTGFPWFGNFRNYIVYDRTLTDTEIATISQQLLRG